MEERETMHSETVQIRMLGEFSIRKGSRIVNDGDSRSRKLWLLLAYMIYCRSRSISLEELADFLWGDSERSSNPLNALKTMFHRVRTILDKLGEEEGRRLIINKDGCYSWNPDVPVCCDMEQFDALCREAEETEEEERQKELILQALDLYQGDFLPKLAGETWVLQVSAYFHNLYIRVAMTVLPILEKQNLRQDAVDLCRKGIALDPDFEPFYQHLMQNLVDQNKQREVAAVYEDLSKHLSETFGVMPSEESLAIYREAVRTTNYTAVSIDTVQKQLREPEKGRGALYCDYDFFKAIYHAEARAVVRSGNAVHLAMISVTGENNRELPKRSLDRCMENLQALMSMNLRKGDILAQCSATQYVLLLPMANFENSCMVCERIIKAFGRKYPHSPAVLHYSVQAIEPNT